VTTSHLECPFKETDPDVRDLLYTAINHVLEVGAFVFVYFKKLKLLGIAHIDNLTYRIHSVPGIKHGL
jgi:hypothetical protein